MTKWLQRNGFSKYLFYLNFSDHWLAMSQRAIKPKFANIIPALVHTTFPLTYLCWPGLILVHLAGSWLKQRQILSRAFLVCLEPWSDIHYVHICSAIPSQMNHSDEMSLCTVQKKIIHVINNHKVIQIWQSNIILCKTYGQNLTITKLHRFAKIISFNQLDWANSAPTYPQTGYHSRNMFWLGIFHGNHLLCDIIMRKT